MSPNKKNSSIGRSKMNVSGLVRVTVQQILSNFAVLPDSAKDEVVKTLNLLHPGSPGKVSPPVVGESGNKVVDPKTPLREKTPKSVTSKVSGWDRDGVKDHPSAVWLRMNATDKIARASDEGRNHSNLLSALLAACSRGKRQNVSLTDITEGLGPITTVIGTRQLWPVKTDHSTMDTEEAQAPAAVSAVASPRSRAQILTKEPDPLHELDEELIEGVAAGSETHVNDFLVVGRRLRTDRIDTGIRGWVDPTSAYHHRPEIGPMRPVGVQLRAFLTGRIGDFSCLSGRVLLRTDGVVIFVAPPDWDTKPGDSRKRVKRNIDDVSDYD